MLGRYSLDDTGLQITSNSREYTLFNNAMLDRDGIVLISDTEYFDDDIVRKFEEFIAKTFGNEFL